MALAVPDGMWPKSLVCPGVRCCVVFLLIALYVWDCLPLSGALRVGEGSWGSEHIPRASPGRLVWASRERWVSGVEVVSPPAFLLRARPGPHRPSMPPTPGLTLTQCPLLLAVSWV